MAPKAGKGPAFQRKSSGRGLSRRVMLNPITALAFVNSDIDGRDYLLAGQDNHILVYDVELSALCMTIPIFEAQSIHGIRTVQAESGCQRLLVWGGHFVALLPRVTIGPQDSSQAGVIEARAPDWIYDGLISPFGPSSFILLTAHNEILPSSYDEARHSLDFGSLVSPSRPILYSGTLLWEALDCVLVAAGTVFGEILVWKYLPSDPTSPSQMLHVFTGHEGSIFGVNISPQISVGDGFSLRLLASCSDDRTIRVWDISDQLNAQERPHEHNGSGARETGFGGIALAAADEASSRCLATAMGHVSRIWHVQFPPSIFFEKETNSVILWSFGEDSTAQKWSLPLSGRGPAGPTRQLSHVLSISAHSGKNLWAQTMTSHKDSTLLIATGGSDGKISLIQSLPQDGPRTSYLDLADIPALGQSSAASKDEDETNSEQCSDSREGLPSNSATSKKKRSKPAKKEILHRYKFISEDTLLATTSFGRVLVGNPNTPPNSWTSVPSTSSSPPAVFSPCAIESSIQHSIGFIGSITGDILVYKGAGYVSLDLLTTVQGKVASLYHLSSQSDESTTQKSHLLVTMVGSEKAYLLTLDLGSKMIIAEERILELPSAFIATSAAFCGSALVIGSRTGKLAIFERNADDFEETGSSLDSKMRDAVTTILAMPEVSHPSGSATFLTTCRDGRYRIHELHRTDNASGLRLLHETSPPLGPMLEGAWFARALDGNLNLIICGFRSKNFVVWNETQGHDVATVDCGGGHRTFTFSPISDFPDGVNFVYTKASQTFAFSQKRPEHRVLKTGGHGREVRALSFSGKYLATAAEDTIIRIWDYSSFDRDRSADLPCLAVIEKHATGIQTLKWHGNTHLFSSGGNEEFYVWGVSELESDYRGLAVVCEARFPDQSEGGDLRIMDFDIQSVERKKSAAEIDEAMEQHFLVSMALSNSVLQTYNYSKSQGFSLVGRGTYTGACLTQLRHIDADERTLRVVTAATDGCLTFWEADLSLHTGNPADKLKSIDSTKMHQSAIKALDVRRLGQNSYIVATGGDDNGLGVMGLHYDGATGRPVLEYKAIVRSAHAAAITGTAISSYSDSGAAIIVTNGNDQRVKTWRLECRGAGQVRIALLDDQYSSVADSGDLEVLDDGQFAIGGVGLEFWDIQDIT